MVNTIFVLDKGYNTSRILVANRDSQKTFWDDLYTQEFDTGAESFEFSCYSDNSIKEGNHIVFFYNGQYKMFTIVELEEEHRNDSLVCNCYCETSSLALLNHQVRPFSGDINCIQFFQHILENTAWTVGRYSTSLTEKLESVKISGIESVWSLIEDYKDIFKCEINCYVTYENGVVTGQYIDVYSEGSLGDVTNKRFEYGKNVTGITKTKDLYEWCTGLILDVECDVTNVTIDEDDGYGFVKGVGDIILNNNANRMHNAGLPHVIGVYKGTEKDPVEAILNAWEELKRRSEPHFDYEVTTALKREEYEDIHLGDTVHVIDYGYTPPLFLEARVGKLELSFTDGTANKCVLTNYKEIKSKLLSPDYVGLTGTIEDIVSSFFPLGPDGIADGAIVDGKIETTYYQEITADIVSAGIGVFEDLYAQGMTVINADIENLRATNADIDNLKAKLAEIDTLINGHLTSDNIQSLILTSDKVTVEDAFIKDAMIDTITANKITSGSINTDNVYISSADGSMILDGSLQQFKDKDGNVRIQIGKDAQGDFTFSLFDENGTGVLIDENGITENAIADGLIVNDMVAEDAGIAGSKLDIDSVVTEINEGTTTIKGTKIVVDDNNQTLDVAFSSLSTKVDEVQETTDSNSTAINVQQGQIDTLISNTTITKENGEVVQLKDEYNSTKDTVDSHTTKIGSLETTVNDVSSKQSSMELDLDGFKSTVTSTYATKSELDITSSNATDALNTANSAKEQANANANTIETMTTKQSTLEQSVDRFKVEVSDTYLAQGEAESLYATKSELTQASDSLTVQISNTGSPQLLPYGDMQKAKTGWGTWNSVATYEEVAGRKLQHFAPTSQDSTVTFGAQLPTFQVKFGTVYTAAFWAESTTLNTLNNNVLVMSGSEQPLDSVSFDSTTTGEMVRVSITFTAPYTGEAFLRIGYSGTNETGLYFRIHQACVYEGYVAFPYKPYYSEIHNNTAYFDQEGIGIVHDDGSSCKMTHEEVRFENIYGAKKMAIKKGTLYTYDTNDGTLLGMFGSNKVNNNEYRGVTTGLAGSSSYYMIGVTSELADDEELLMRPYILVAQEDLYNFLGHEGISGGINFMNTQCIFHESAYFGKSPRIKGGFVIYKEDDTPINIYFAESNNAINVETNMVLQNGGNYYGGGLYGYDVTSMGYNLNGQYTDVIKLYASIQQIDFLRPLNMNGFGIYNAYMASTVQASSTYTRSLASEGTTENVTQSVMAFADGEVIYTHRETCHTAEEWDYNENGEYVPLGKYYCYCELPVFMAENIEIDYHVNIGKSSWGDYRVIEKNSYLFIVESQEEGFAFTWQVVAKLRDS